MSEENINVIRKSYEAFNRRDLDVIRPRRCEPREPVPSRFWLHRRGALPAIVWNTQRVLGRRWYRSHVRGRPALNLKRAQTITSRA